MLAGFTGKLGNAFDKKSIIDYAFTKHGESRRLKEIQNC
jgi:hypothetical protein